MAVSFCMSRVSIRESAILFGNLLALSEMWISKKGPAGQAMARLCVRSVKMAALKRVAHLEEG